MNEFRLLKTGYNDAFTNMAIDEAILKYANELGKPTIRFYGWKPSAVSIGYFQSMKDEVNLDVCKEHEIDVIRRITGGGAVFHDTELTYSFVCTEESNIVSKDILESYSTICGAIINGLREIGINSEFAPINDIVVSGKKISGNAQTRREKTVLQHGTILMEVDVEKMFSLLLIPNEKIRDKMIASVKERVTSIEQLLGKKLSFEEIQNAMIKGFETQFKVKLTIEDLTKEEKQLAEKIKKERFSKKEWNFKR